MIKLKRPSIRDEEGFLRAVRRSRSLHKGLVSPPATPESYQRFVRSLRRRNCVGFLVTLRDTGDLVGVVDVNEIVRGFFQSAYLGYYAFVPHAGCGLMRQGIQQVIEYCFKELKLHRLEANIQPQNARSIALAESLGFEKEGYSPRYLKICSKWRDHERWAIVKEQWRRPSTVRVLA